MPSCLTMGSLGILVYPSNENACSGHATTLENDKFVDTLDSPACTQNVFVCNELNILFYFWKVNDIWRTFSNQDPGQ